MHFCLFVIDSSKVLYKLDGKIILLPWGIKKKIARRINFMIYYEVDDENNLLKIILNRGLKD